MAHRTQQRLSVVPGHFYVNLRTGFPKTWDEVMENLTSYPASQYNDYSTVKAATTYFAPTSIFIW